MSKQKGRADHWRRSVASVEISRSCLLRPAPRCMSPTARAATTSTRTFPVEDTPGTARGGTCIAHVVDHTDDAAIAEVFARIGEQHGGLDLVVANAFNGNALPFGPGTFWELPMEHWSHMVDAGLRSHLVTARHSAPLLIETQGSAGAHRLRPAHERQRTRLLRPGNGRHQHPRGSHRARPRRTRRRGHHGLSGFHPHRSHPRRLRRQPAPTRQRHPSNTSAVSSPLCGTTPQPTSSRDAPSPSPTSPGTTGSSNPGSFRHEHAVFTPGSDRRRPPPAGRDAGAGDRRRPRRRHQGRRQAHWRRAHPHDS
jgi:NAD(P)-dependent dehydrogenase (short-subunit alcohol dehydrogenase family)